MDKQISRKNIIASELFGLVLAFFGVSACQQEGGPASAPRPPEVKIMTVVARTLPAEVEFIGQTASFRPVEIRSQVTGVIKKVLYAESRDVRKGDKLYLIESLPFKAAAASAKGRVGQALARLAQARAELARVTPLLAEQAVSQKAVDDAIAEKLAAEAALVTAKGDWEKAKFDLRNTLIVAPVAGRPERSRLYEGRLVAAQTDLLTSIHQMDPMYVNVNVPENYILRRHRELAARRVERPDLFQLTAIMFMADGTIYPHEGTLDFPGIGFRAETGSLSARFKFPNMLQTTSPGGSDDYPLYALRPGQFVKIRVRGYMRKDAILVPQRSVQQNPNGLFVYIVGGKNKVERRMVTASIWHEQEWLIEDGLHPGEQIVVEGLHRIRPGTQVNPLPYQPNLPSSEQS